MSSKEDSMEITQAQNYAFSKDEPGNIIFRTGLGYPDPKGNRPDPGGSFIFQLPDGTEFMRIEPGGKVFVCGTLVDEGDHATTYRQFMRYLALSHAQSIDGRELNWFLSKAEKPCCCWSDSNRDFTCTEPVVERWRRRPGSPSVPTVKELFWCRLHGIEGPARLKLYGDNMPDSRGVYEIEQL
jgi:hypothetical protein